MSEEEVAAKAKQIVAGCVAYGGKGDAYLAIINLVKTAIAEEAARGKMEATSDLDRIRREIIGVFSA